LRRRHTVSGVQAEEMMDEVEASPPQGAPEDFEGLRDLLTARRDSLPKRLKQLATFALAHPEDMAFGTVAEIADHAGVQPSTLVRFAQTLGYDGFSHLQQIFRARLRERFPDYRERLRVLRSAEARGSRLASHLEGFLGAATISLDRLRDSVAVEDLEQAVEILAKAETIYLLGARRVFPISAYLAYAFGKLGIRAILIDHVAQLGPEQLSTATERDAVLAISFTPYAPSTADLAAGASRRKVPVVAITDSAFSPLTDAADLWLEVAEADYGAFRSLSASFALAMTLAVGTAEKRAET
jgi:DNA-binding MurR/RpiR family transcriptional regulator